MSNSKIIVAGWYAVDPKRRDDIVESFEPMVRRARSTPGCLDFAITADPSDPERINICELWRTEKELNSWRAASRSPKKFPPILRMEVQKHVIERSGPPFGRRHRES